jgi:hypothetical protein
MRFLMSPSSMLHNSSESIYENDPSAMSKFYSKSTQLSNCLRHDGEQNTYYMNVVFLEEQLPN